MDIGIKYGLSQARALAGERWQPLLIYTALGVLLPYVLLSSEPIFSLRNIMAIFADPFTYRVGGSITGPLYLLAIVSVIAAGAMLAAWNAILIEMREGAISEIMYGMVAGFAYLAANIFLYLVVGVIVVLPILLIGGVAQWSEGAGGVLLEIYRVILSLLGTWIGARFCLAGAIMGERGKLEPFSAFAESWRRTATAQWRLFGFYFLYGLGFGIALAGLILLHGMIIISNEPGAFAESLMSIAWILLLGAYFIGQLLIPAGFLRASQPGVSASEVFA
jgi:hypothetical protein